VWYLSDLLTAMPITRNVAARAALGDRCLDGVPPEMFERIAIHARPKDLMSLRLVSRGIAAKVLRTYEARLFSRLVVMVCSEDSLRGALERARHPFVGPRIRKIAVYENLPEGSEKYDRPEFLTTSNFLEDSGIQITKNLDLLKEVLETRNGMDKQTVLSINGVMDLSWKENNSKWPPYLEYDAYSEETWGRRKLATTLSPKIHDAWLLLILDSVANYHFYPRLWTPRSLRRRTIAFPQYGKDRFRPFSIRERIAHLLALDI
jgi:hypothetical protein